MVRALILATAILSACSFAEGSAPRTTLVPPVQSTPQPTPTPYVVDRIWLQGAIMDSTNANWQRTGVRGAVTRVLCVTDTDALHLVCNLLVSGSPYFSSLTVKATCDTLGGCVWRPE